MLKFFKIGYKNVIRHKRRTLLTIFMIICVVTITLVLEGFIEASRKGWLLSIIHTQTGHIQIVKKGYREKSMTQTLDLLIENPKAIEKIIKNNKSIRAFTERLSFGGMIATETKTAIFSGIGIDPVNDYDIFDLIQAKVGTRLMPYHKSGCLIGSGLAKNLGLKVGSSAILISNTIEGAINAINVEIVGIFHSGVPQKDNLVLYIPLKDAQRLLNLNGQVSKIIILIEDIDKVDKEVNNIRKLLKNNFPDIEIVTWEQLAGLFKRIQSMYRFQANIIELIMFSLIAISICIIMLMSVFERTREIGTMSAFGIKRSEIIFLFLCESMIIGIIGGLLGVMIGIGVTKLLYIIGIPFNPPDTDILVYIRPIVLYNKAIYIFLFSIFTTIIGGLYPSIRTSKIRPSEAFRFV